MKRERRKETNGLYFHRSSYCVIQRPSGQFAFGVSKDSKQLKLLFRILSTSTFSIYDFLRSSCALLIFNIEHKRTWYQFKPNECGKRMKAVNWMETKYEYGRQHIYFYQWTELDSIRGWNSYSDSNCEAILATLWESSWNLIHVNATEPNNQHFFVQVEKILALFQFHFFFISCVERSFLCVIGFTLFSGILRQSFV